MSDIRFDRLGNNGCEGERGERGERGRRGHRGPTGPTGSFGSTGATGPSGVSPQGLAAYGYLVGIDDDTILANADVTFGSGIGTGLGFPILPGGSAFTLLSDGDYEFNFYVVGQHANGSTVSLEFGLFGNGFPLGAAYEFRSNQGTGVDAINDIQVVRGQGIIHLVAGTAVSVRNRTGSGTGGLPVFLTAVAPGGEQGANRTFTMKKLSA